MKVLIVNTNPTNHEGVTNVIFNLLENINKSEIQFGYVSINTPNKEFINRFNNLNCNLYVVPRKITQIKTYIHTLSKIARNYDIIHVHGNSATLAIDLLAAKIGDIRYRLAHSHNTSCKMVIADKLLRPLFYTLCNGRLACGYDAGKWLYGNRSFEIIQNGINTARFRFNQNKRAEIRKSLGWEEKIIIGHVGNFTDAKNHKFIFDIIKETIKKNNKIRLVCVGGGRMENSYREYIKKLGLTDDIYLAGNVGNPEDYMSAMDAVLMPSLHEGLPLTLVEEQANGLTCLISDAITTEVDLTGNLHFLALKEPINVWSDKLLEIVNNKIDDRSNISDHCIYNIKERGYDIHTEANKLGALYLSFIDQSNKKKDVHTNDTCYH